MDNEFKDVTVFILAGGLGTRLSHIVKDVPKPMADVSGKPFLEWQLMWLRDNGFRKIVILVGHKKDIIIDYFNDGEELGLSIDYSVEEELLGTGGAVLNALKQYPSRCFIILNGDSFFNINLKWFVTYCLNQKKEFVLALKYLEDTSRYGFVEIDENYKIKEFYEKKQWLGDGYINGGIYFGQSNLFKDYPVSKCSMENDLFPNLLNNEKLTGIPFGENFIDIGIPHDYDYAQKMLPDWYGKKKLKALFLDRDGIIIEDSGYVSSPGDVKLIIETIDVVKTANRKGIPVIVVTNQSGIARGYYSVEDMNKVHEYINNEYSKNEAFIDSFYYSPYHPDGIIKEFTANSLLRKPQPGMILQAVNDLEIDVYNSIMIGDKDSDLIQLPYLKSFLIHGKYEINNQDKIISFDDLPEFL